MNTAFWIGFKRRFMSIFQHPTGSNQDNIVSILSLEKATVAPENLSSPAS